MADTVSVEPTADSDPVVLAARQVDAITQKRSDLEDMARAEGDTPRGRALTKTADRLGEQVDAIGDFLAGIDCQSIEGAAAQVIQIVSIANYCGTQEGDLTVEHDKIERLARSVLRFLAPRFQIDLLDLGGDYFIGCHLHEGQLA